MYKLKEIMTESNGTEPVSPLEQKIIKQIEYYFGDVNLMKDKFLQEQVKQEDGWVPLETMIKFNRLKQLSDDFEVLTKAIKKSTSGLMEVDEDGKKIRRSPSQPLPEHNEERRSDLKRRCVYAKGFPVDASLDDIQEFLEKFGGIEHIQMRRLRDAEKTFKGSVFAIFNTKEAAEKFLEEESVKYSETDLVRMWKDDYFKKKTDEKKVVDRKRKLEDEQKQKEDSDERFLERITKGALLRITGIDKEVKREDIKEFFNSISKVHWVDFDTGDSEAIVRFEEEGQAQVAWDKAKEQGEGKVTFKDKEVEGKVVEGDEEINHWKDLFQTFANRRGKGRGRGRGGRGGGRGWGRGGRGGRRSHSGPQGKKTKFDSDDEGGDGDDADGDSEPPAKQAKLEESEDQ